MRPPRPSRHLACLTATTFVLLGAALPLRADDRVVYDARATETPGFFHRVGDFFRDLFATEQSLSPRPTPPRPTAPRFNLDLPPPGTGYGYGWQAGHNGVESTEQSMTIDAHNAAAKRSRTTTTKRSTTTVVASSDSPPVVHKSVEG